MLSQAPTGMPKPGMEVLQEAGYWNELQLQG